MGLRPEKNNIVYTDAAGDGGLGTVVIKFDHHASPFPSSSGQTPEWCAGENIYTKELLKAVVGAAHIAEVGGSGHTIFFGHNDAAHDALIRGTSDHDVPRLLIGAF